MEFIPMRRFLLPLLAVLLVAVSSSSRAADPKTMTLRWHGQSFFSLETPAGARIVFDPHAIEAYGRNTMTADLVLITHFHDDHTRVGVIENYQKAKTIAGLKGVGKKIDWNIVDEKISLKKGEDIRIRTVGTFHDDSQGMERGRNAAFIVEIDGVKICHLGDLGHKLTEDQVKRIGKGTIDVLLIPVGGIYTLNGAEAKQVVDQLEPRGFIVPMHYGTKVYEDVLTAAEFLEKFKKERIREEKGNDLVITVGAKQPAEPTVVVLNWAAKP